MRFLKSDINKVILEHNLHFLAEVRLLVDLIGSNRLALKSFDYPLWHQAQFQKSLVLKFYMRKKLCI